MKERKITAAVALLVFAAALSFLTLERRRAFGAAFSMEASAGEASAGALASASGKALAGGEEQKEAPRVALTFDDGPHPHYTLQLLEGLKERGVKATFFVTGQNAEAYPDIVRRLGEEGHLIGNHTYSHIQLTEENRSTFRDELVRTNEIITEITGKEVLYVRPPYGSWDKKLEAELNMFPVLWNVDPLDWCSDDASCVAGRVISQTCENDIILMHDCYATSVTAALDVIDELSQRGYEFVTVDEILFD